MSDPRPQRPGDFDDLEPMDELDELEPLAELDELEEFLELDDLDPVEEPPPPAPPKPAPAPAASPTPPPARPAPPQTPPAPVSTTPAVPVTPAAAPSAGLAAAATPSATEPSGAADSQAGAPTEPARSRPAAGQRRELDRAPILLRKAALLLLAASLIPWGDAQNLEVVTTGTLWAGTIAEKAILYAAVWIFLQSHVLKYGGQVPGALASLKPKGLMILAGVVSLVGMFPLVTGEVLFPTLSEKALLLLAGFTYVHIFDYEHGGKFNPIFPLLFLTPALGGLLAIFRVMADGPPGLAALLLGTLPVTISGFLAMYTMFVALKQAKLEGDQKKEAALAARKAARGERPSPGGGAPGGVVRRRERS